MRERGEERRGEEGRKVRKVRSKDVLVFKSPFSSFVHRLRLFSLFLCEGSFLYLSPWCRLARAYFNFSVGGKSNSASAVEGGSERSDTIKYIPVFTFFRRLAKYKC
jgi:hypothetical protein